MRTTLKYSLEVYITHLPLILLFSLSFLIAFLIPIFASFPTYNDMGGIFLRLSSLLVNLTQFTTAIIIFSTLFSLLFLSFAIVAMNVIVKHSRTHTKIRQEVVDGLEKYTAKVFITLLFFTIIVAFFEISSYIYGISQLLSALIAIVMIPFFFYAPASIVMDDASVLRAMKASMKFFIARFDYIILWFVMAMVLLTVFDYVFILAGGTNPIFSRYLTIIFNAIFIMPFLVVLQSQSYIGRFGLLKR
ncbi:MAG: hypothetical protein ACHQX1_02870 [Candidatus Micrarchaeales archaeon]